jgi:putative transferase (TIGR04331 family)
LKIVPIDEVFLATTALEGFWDVSKPIVFLGDWCLLYERRSYWDSLEGKLLNGPYDHPYAAENAYYNVNRIFEQLLPIIGAALNDIHGKSHSSRYWRILIGPWLQLYLSAIYDRYVHIRCALDQYPGFVTIGLSEDSFVVPADTLDFACFLLEDSYNLQLYTKIMSALGKDFPSKKNEVPRNPLYGKLLGNTWRRRAISYAAKVFAGVNVKSSKTILLKNSYFSKQIELQLAARNIGRILPSWNQMIPCQRFKRDGDKRNALRTIGIGESEFEQCLSTMLFSDMPQCFVEGFHTVEHDACKNYPRQVKAIFSANGWYYDEAFKQWAAQRADEGTLLLGTQHGGIYGGLKIMPSEDHETAIVDYYYSWGWERADCRSKIIPMPATKLAERKEIGADNSKKGVLWAATSSPRYVVQLPFLPKHFQEYLAWQTRFANALPQEVMAEISFRPHYENYSWGTVERMKACVPCIRIESWDVPFQVSLENCRLYVCDHLSTTFAEALAANKPTVLFCSPETNKLRPKAQPYFDLLRAGGILFDTPETAASAVAAVYDDVEAWWNAPERQQAVQIFCARFARTSPDAIDLWSNEIKRVSDLPYLQ